MVTAHQFFVDEGGHVHETRVFEAVARLKTLFPDLDPDSLEAEIMVERCHRLLANDRDAQWVPYGLTGSRFILLRMLFSAADKRLTMGQVASQMNLEPNNVTQLTNALVREGWVERKPAEDDKRVVYATITQKGEDLFAEVMEQAADRTERAFSVLSNRDRQYLSHLLSKVRMHLLASPRRLEEDHPQDHNRAKQKTRELRPPGRRT